MSRFKKRFTLHQVYAHYAREGDLNWRDLGESAHASTRTLRKYFGSTDSLAKTLVDYHLSYLNNYYTKVQIRPQNPQNIQFEKVRLFIARNMICYQFTDKAHKNDLAKRGIEIYEKHIDYIRQAMIRGGAKENKINPEMAFNFFLTPLPDNEKGRDFFMNMLKWFTS